MAIPTMSSTTTPVPCCNGEVVGTLFVTETAGIASDAGGAATIALDVEGCASMHAGTPTSPIRSVTSKNTVRRHIATDATRDNVALPLCRCYAPACCALTPHRNRSRPVGACVCAQLILDGEHSAM